MFEAIAESTQSMVDSALRLVGDTARWVGGLFKAR